MYKNEMYVSVKEAIEQATDRGYEEGKKRVVNDLKWLLQNYKNDAGLRTRIEMYIKEFEDDKE